VLHALVFRMRSFVLHFVLTSKANNVSGLDLDVIFINLNASCFISFIFVAWPLRTWSPGVPDLTDLDVIFISLMLHASCFMLRS
jgi:hypothetical protein